MANKALHAIITIGGAVSGSLGSAIGGTQRRLQRLGSTVRDLTRQQRELGASINDAMRNGRPVGDMAQRYRELQRQIERARQEQDRLNRASRSMADARNMRAGAAGRIGSTVTAGAVVGLPLIGAAKSAMNYDYQLQMIGNTADMTKEQIAELDARIMQTSKDVNQSAPNMQKAFGFLIAAGMDVGQAGTMLATVGKTATAAGAEVEDMAKTTFTLNDSLKITSETGMIAAMDALAKAGKMGNFELKAMSQNLPVLGSSFSALKMEGLEAVATIGAALQIARKGAGDEAEAANNLKNYMAKLQSPETLKKAAKFGLDLNKVIVDAQASGKNPFEAATQALFKTIGNDQKKLGEIFQDMQVQNFLRPMFQNMEKYEEIKKAALNSGGTVDTDFLKIMGTSKEQVDKVGGAVGRLVIRLGEAMTAMIGTGNTFADKVDNVTKWVTANKELIGTTVKVVGSLALLSVGINSVVYVFGAAKTVWTVGGLALNVLAKGGWLLTAALNGLATVAPLVVGGIRMVGTAFMIMGRALLLNPIGLVITAVAVGAALIIANWSTVGPWFAKLWEGMKTVASEAWTAIKNLFFEWHPLGIVIKNWEPIKDYFSGLFNDIKATVGGAVDWVLGKIGKVGELWGKTKSLFSWGDDGKPAPAGAPAPRTPPPAPPLASARGQATQRAGDTNTYHITQQPGESGEALAKRVARINAAKRTSGAGSALYDSPRGY